MQEWLSKPLKEWSDGTAIRVGHVVMWAACIVVTVAADLLH